uniref:Uncharacterized protein n=1 Tax=Parascaris univalens TaxID=6257 RepID=A0A915BI92_PARUN
MVELNSSDVNGSERKGLESLSVLIRTNYPAEGFINTIRPLMRNSNTSFSKEIVAAAISTNLHIPSFLSRSHSQTYLIGFTVVGWTQVTLSMAISPYVLEFVAVIGVVRVCAQFVPGECGLQDGVLFCADLSICSRYCERPCESITSSELRNMNYFAEERIRTIPGKVSADDNFLNYFDIEMNGLRPGICGTYAVQKLPRFLVTNRKSVFEQIVAKLHIELDRTLYAHSQCEQSCSFGCEEVGYNGDVIKALKRSSIRSVISLHECKPIPAWLTYLTVSSVYALFILIGLLIYKFGIPEEADILRIIKNEYNARRSERRVSKPVASSASSDVSNSPPATPARSLSPTEYGSD